MKKISSFLALLILVIPGALGVYGWTMMRDAIFSTFGERFEWLHFLLGLVLFIASLAFVGGFIFYRDKKRKKVQKRFLDDIE